MRVLRLLSISLLLLNARLAAAATVWWHVAGADTHHRRLLEHALNQTLPKVARLLPGAVNATTADYLVDEDDVAAVEDAIAAFNPLYTDVRRASDDPRRWVTLDWLNDPPPRDVPAAYSVLNQAAESLTALDQLHAKFSDQGDFAAAIHRLGRDLFERLVEVGRPEFDLYVLTHGTLVGAAAAPVLAHTPRLFDVFLDTFGETLRAAPRTRAEFDPHLAEFKNPAGEVQKMDLKHLGVEGALFYRFDPKDRAERELQHLPGGLPFLRLAAPDAEAARARVIRTARALYDPLAAQVEAKNESDLLRDFTGTLAEPSLMREAWDKSGRKTLPRPLVDRLSAALEFKKVRVREVIKMRAEVVRDRARPALGSANFYNFMTGLADAGVNVRDVFSDDPLAVDRYYQNAFRILHALITEAPPTSGTLYALLDGAGRLRENLHRDLPLSADGHRVELHSDFAALHARIREIQKSACGARLAH